MKIGGATGLSGLWALEWAWHTYETNLRCAGIFRICMPNPSIAALIVFEITAFIRTDRETDMARSTRLVILFKNEYTSNFNFFSVFLKLFFIDFVRYCFAENPLQPERIQQNTKWIPIGFRQSEDTRVGL